MDRRDFVRAAAIVAGTTLVGCLGNGREVNGHLEYDDVRVPLIDTPSAGEWHEEGSAEFFDARNASSYESVHIAGAELSPAPDGETDNDPSEDLSPDTRIVTYCRCPHSMSGSRAANLLRAGFESVYVLDEGLDDWVDRGYPIEGTDANGELSSADLGTPAYRDE